MDESDLSRQADPPVPTPAAESVVAPRRRTIFLTVLLCLLSGMVIGVMRHAENRYGSAFHAAYHWQSLERSLLVQSVYETEPPAVRWLSGYFSLDAFYQEQNALALAAERDGYLALHSRQAMAIVAHRAGDFGKTAYWCDGPPDHLHGPKLAQENRDAIRLWKPTDRPALAEIVRTSGSTLSSKDAKRFYWVNAGAFSILLGLGILLLPSGRTVIRLLRGKNGNPVGHDKAAVESWQPGRMLGGWLRASWLFAFSGIAITACYYVAGATLSEWMPGDYGSWKVHFSETYLRYHNLIFAGWRGVILSMALFAAPVYLLARKFAGGLRGMWRIFGLTAPGLPWTRLLNFGAGATWMAVTTMFLTAPVCLRLGWFDSRDGWRFEGESLPLGILYGCLLAPLIEELVFRGFLFSAFANRWPVPRAALFSSLIFAAVHGYSWSGFVTVTAYGMLFCGLFRRTGSLWPGMIAHALINMFLLVLQSVA